MTTSRRDARTQAPSISWLVFGIILALAPAILWLIAAFVFPFGGPLNAALIYAIPVLATTVGAILIAVSMIRRGRRDWGLWIGYTALIVGVIAYAAWTAVLITGLQSGNGPY